MANRRTSAIAWTAMTAGARSTSMGSVPRIIAERVEYLDENGKLVTESLRDFTKKALKKRFASLDEFLKRWKAAERKQAIIEELGTEGLAARPARRGGRQGPRSVRPHLPRRLRPPPLTRRERAENVRKRDVFTKYGPQARAVLEALLAEVPGRGRRSISTTPTSCRSPPFNAMGTPVQLIKAFGDRADFEQAVHELQSALYQEAA